MKTLKKLIAETIESENYIMYRDDDNYCDADDIDDVLCNMTLGEYKKHNVALHKEISKIINKDFKKEE